MSTALKIVLAMLAAGGFALLSLVLVTHATVKVALCGVATVAAAGLFLWVAFTMPDPVPMFVGMGVCIGSVACLIRSLLGFSSALDDLAGERALRRMDDRDQVAA